MRHTTLTIFDFDGTLYPITSYDSEQMLVLAEAKNRSRLFKKRCNHFIEQDQRGAFNDTSFHQHYATLVRRTTEATINAVADTLLSSVGEKEKTALLRLASISDLGIVTCGTENIAWAFLEKLGVAKKFSFIRGKRLRWNEKGTAELMVDIAEPQAKATVVDSLRTAYDTIIAIGDGPTDIPMLERADLGLIVSWGKQNRQYPYKTFPNLESAVLHVYTHLESNNLASLSTSR